MIIHSSLKQAAVDFFNISDSPQLDAELLLAHVLGRNRHELRGKGDQALSDLESTHFNSLITRRQQGEPIAYLIGHQEFYLDSFVVTPAVLIPRPETELLIDIVKSQADPTSPLDLLDLGTGSGAIGLTLAGLFGNAKITMTDVSIEALEVAKLNAKRLQRESQITLLHGAWFACVASTSRYDFILANPPYLQDNDPHAEAAVLAYEPKLALSAGPSGLEALTHIIDMAPRFLKPNGQLWLEHGINQAAAVRDCLTERGFSQVRSLRDLAQIERVSGGQWVG